MEDLTDIINEIAALLRGERATVATAESCTGGRIASFLTSVAGASEWYNGGIVAYTKMAKQEVLGVPAVELADGLITERCAKAMATAAADRLDSNYAVATTGVCGPTPSEGHRPCTAWIAVRSPKGIETRLFRMEDLGRQANIETVSRVALQMLLHTVREEAAASR
ncbi:MAG: CinA family protein [Porphyromonas sp.]|nr:CinA family protein [Porphyromonas sp.]